MSRFVDSTNSKVNFKFEWIIDANFLIDTKTFRISFI